MMRGPPGLPMTITLACPPSRSTVGDIDESGRLPAAGALAAPPDQAVQVRGPGRDGEVVHLVVQEEAAART
jgi:hypothetical protein